EVRAQAQPAGAAFRQQARLHQALQLEVGDRQLRLERALERAAQVRRVLERLVDLERRQRAQAQGLLAGELHHRVERGLALLEEDADLRVHLLDLLGAEIVALDRK